MLGRGTTPAWAPALPFALGASALIAVFAFDGPRGTWALFALAAAGLWGISLLPFTTWRAALPLLVILLPLPQLMPGIIIFDLVVPFLALAALFVTLRSKDRRVWDVRGPGWVSAIALFTPLLALPGKVISILTFLGGYQLFVGSALTFHALRRLVPPRESKLLLWAFPIFGFIAVNQLMSRVQGLGFRLGRLEFRNFYTDLGWGFSNYVGAVFVLCICGTTILFMIERNPWIRVILIGVMALLVQGITLSYARGATVALAVFVLFLLLGLSARARWITAVAAGLAGFAYSLSPAGKIVVARFVDPTQLGSMQRRFVLWQEAWDRFLQNPWTGIGLSQGRYQNDRMGLDWSHNTGLDYLNEQGIFGFVGYVVLLIAILRLCRRADPGGTGGPPESTPPVRVASLALVAAVVTNSMVEVTWPGHVHGILLAFFLAWLALQDPRALAEERSST